jgi:hypothetical protein
MKKTNEHPEITEIKNICDVSPKTKLTKGVCDKLNNKKGTVSNAKSSHHKK